jgi:peroxiredoxin
VRSTLRIQLKPSWFMAIRLSVWPMVGSGRRTFAIGDLQTSAFAANQCILGKCLRSIGKLSGAAKKMNELSGLPNDVLIKTPQDLPIPADDGACNHLVGCFLPSLELQSTSGDMVNLSTYSGWVVVYCYPMTGRPGRAIPEGWAGIPGAAGCTPQSCSFRDNHAGLRSLGATVFGMSTQTTEDQIEASQRLKLPYDLLSDNVHSFARALNLPVFDIAGLRLLKRVTLIVKDSKIVKYFYPVFPPDQNAHDVHAWLQLHAY